MRRLFVGGLLVLAVGTLAFGQPPGGKKDGKGKGPPPFRMGKVIPPFVMSELDLSREQLDQLAELEKDVKTRLDKILTEKQKKQIESLRGRGPTGGFQGKGKPPRQDDQTSSTTGGIQWFATLERGLAEARRTHRPILFLAAAPHCGGVPGMW